MRSKYNTWIQIGLLLLGLMGSVYVACTPANSMMRWYNVDDAFYYYKVAQNVLAGHGFSFDQITFTNGFHPLWMIICLGVFWFSKINILFPLRLLIIVSGIFNALTGVLLFRLLKKSLSTMSAIIGASAWVLVPSIFKITIVHGMESSISAFFIVLLILFAVNYETQLGYKLAKIHHLLLAGLIGALTILARLDNVFVVGILGFFMILRIKSIPKIVIFDAILIAIASFVAWILRLGIQSVDVNRFSIYPMALTAVITMPTIFFFTGVYKTENHNLLRKWMRITFAIGLSFIIEYGLLSILFKLGVLKLLSKSVLAIGTILTFVLIVILHSIFSRQAELISRSPFHVFSDWFKKTWKDIFASGGLYAAPITGIIGAYLVGNKLLFGTFTPVSGQIKQWWSTLPNTIYTNHASLISVLGLSPDTNQGPWSLVTSRIFTLSEFVRLQILKTLTINSSLLFLFFIFVFITLALVTMKLVKNKSTSRVFQLFIPALLLGSIIQITYYNTVGYSHTRSWYWIAELITLVMIGSVILDGIFLVITKFKAGKIIASGFTIVIALAFAWSHIRYVISLAPARVSEEQSAEYLEEVREVEKLTPEGSLIGMTGGGNIAYFLENRTIMNLDGLMNSAQYFEAMKNETARDFLDVFPLDFVYGKPYVLLESDPYNLILADRLQEIGYIRGPENFTLFKYVIIQ